MKNESGIQKEILNLINQQEFCELEKYYKNRTIMDILDVSRKENKHSNFIAWLFNKDAEHCLGDYALRKLLETICFIETKRLENNNGTKSIKGLNMTDIICGNYTLTNISVEREKTIEKNKRIDIYIEYKIKYRNEQEREQFIIIENKINAIENYNQTEDYYSWAKNKGCDFFCLYLSPQTKQEYRDYYKKNKTKCKSPGFINISYQYLVDGIIEPCILRVMPEYKMFIEDYIRCLSQPCISDIDLENNNGFAEATIMAIGKKEKDLVKKIWERNKNILIKLINFICNINGAFEDEERNLLKCFYNTNSRMLKPIWYALTYILDNPNESTHVKHLNTILNDGFSYEFYGKIYKKGSRKENSLGWLGRDLIAKYKEENPAEKIDDFIKMIRGEKNRFSSPWLDEIIIKKTEWDQYLPNRPDHFFEDEGIINWDENEDVYVARYWTKEDIHELSLILKMKDKIKQTSYS